VGPNLYQPSGATTFLPMWIADMDFPVPKPVTEALIKRAQHEAYGYSFAAPSVLDAIMDAVACLPLEGRSCMDPLHSPALFQRFMQQYVHSRRPAMKSSFKAPYTIRSGQLSVRMGARSPTTNCCGTAPGMSWISKG